MVTKVTRDPSSSPHTDAESACRDAETAWRALAQEISGRGRMRVSRDGGRTYPRRYERTIGDAVPNQPAAVLIYDNSGSARTFCVDLDVSRGGIEAVERDYRSLTAILSRLGVAHFADRSPNGGIHVYVPLAEPLPYPDAAATARALAARTPTMDPMPMLGIDSGCIRPPGSRHRTGGHQLLIDPLTDAWKATKEPTTPEAWARFVGELNVEATPPHAPAGSTYEVIEERLMARGRHTAPDATYQTIARTGDYDPDRYATPSEARQAVVWAAVAAGWAFSDVARRVGDGTWPGLAAMYGRYRRASRHGALVRDWRAAIGFEKRRRGTTGVKSVRVGTTRELKTHRGGTYQQIRTWLNAVDLIHDETRRDDLATRAVLLALGEAAQKTASMTVEFGNRSLAIATGLNQATVGKCLKRLAEEERALIILLLPANGVKAHTWQLTIPADLDDTVGHISWRRGTVHGIRAAFRELGLPAAFMYAALEQQHSPAGGRDLARTARLCPTSAYDALDTLAAFGLATRSRDGWSVGAADLAHLAESFGVLDAIREQLEIYRAERRAYWAMLGIIRLTDPTGPVGTYDRAPPPEAPDEVGWTLMDLLEAELGAHVIAQERHVG